MSLEMFQGPSFQENIKFPHNDVERDLFQSICKKTKKNKICNQNSNFFCFGKQRQIILFKPDLQTINHKLNLLPLTMLVDIEERRRKIRVSPIFPKYSKYFREVSFHQEGLLHQGFFTTNFCAGEMAKSCTFLQLITISLTLVFIFTITPISRNLKITADGNRASLAFLASAEPLNSSSWVCRALAKQVNGCSCSSYKECFPLHHGAL